MSEEMAIRKVEDEIFDFIDLLGGISVCTKKKYFQCFFLFLNILYTRNMLQGV